MLCVLRMGRLGAAVVKPPPTRAGEVRTCVKSMGEFRDPPVGVMIIGLPFTSFV